MSFPPCLKRRVWVANSSRRYDGPPSERSRYRWGFHTHPHLVWLTVQQPQETVHSRRDPLRQYDAGVDRWEQQRHRIRLMVEGMNVPQTANRDGRYVAYSPGVDGWVVAVWFAIPPKKATPRMREGEIFFFWHGPDVGGSASHLQSSVAVFPRRADAVEAFVELGAL